MSALQQYLDLYDAHRDMMDSHSAGPINALRERAADVLEMADLPRPDSDNYENCNLEAMLAPDYGININDVNIDVNPANSFRCDVPVTNKSPFLTINDTVAVPDPMPEMPEGVYFGSLKDFAAENPGMVEKYYGTLADINNPVVALDTLLLRDGMLLYVPEGTSVEKPLQLVNILSAGAPLMAIRRLLVIIGDGASARLLVCDHTQRDDMDFLALQTVEIFVGRDASFDLYDLEESTERTSRISALYLSQQAGSHVVIDGMTLFNGVTRNEYFCRFEGEHADLRLYGMGICDRQRKLSTYSRIEHAVPHCHSDELFKISADQEARGAFTGRIHVAEGAVGTEAYQASRNLLASSSARIQARPELEIYNDDVKCSHGCAIGQLDPMQVFYMRTRGISEETAHLLLRQAFMADVIDAVALPALRDRLHLLVERRFAGCGSACASCKKNI